MSSPETIKDKLTSLSAQVISLDPDDKEAVVRLGADLEGVLSDNGSIDEQVSDLLDEILEGFQSVYEKGDDSSISLDQIAVMISSAAERLNDDDEIESGQAVEVAPEAAASEAITTQESPPEEAAPTRLPDEADMELLGEFVVECLDHISASEGSLLELESNPDDVDRIDTIFRAFHTIKGTSGFLGLDPIQKLAHLAENMLDRARDGEIRILGGYADLALRSCDALKMMIEGLNEVEPGQELIVPESLPDLLVQLSDPEGAGICEDDAVEQMRVGEILVGKGQANRDDVERAAKSQDSRPLGQSLIEAGVSKAADVGKALRTQKKMTNSGSSTVRVATDRLDSLINMVGELVIAHSMIAQDPTATGAEAKSSSSRFARNVAHTGKITRELQDLTMSLRMVPLKATFQKMTRLIRDLAQKSGKKVQLVTEGEETEIDRNMVESLGDPLVHMIRNAVDHGIESGSDRLAKGKTEAGTVRLKAYHSSGSVTIELSDDGKGLDRDAIVAKAVERGMVEPGRNLTDSEAFGLIFQPGFSTAAAVTEISGRGVGMDVVKRGLDALRGRIEVASTMGEGSTFTLRLPLTMAITDAMVLLVGRERYLLPTVSIERSFRLRPNDISTVVGRGETILVRGELLPIIRLHRLFNIADSTSASNQGLLIIMEGHSHRCALMVDELLGQQQVVIKSLGQSFEQVPGISGGAILGDGRVGLILDAVGLVQLAHDDPADSRPAERTSQSKRRATADCVA